MKRIPLIILTIAMLTVVAAAGVFAQSGETTALDENSAALTIVESVTANAQVEVTINGESYMITVPVTVNIDAQRDLSDALLKVPAVDRVGDLRWKITSITEIEEDYELNSFNVLEPSSGNKLVVVTSSLTNLDSRPFTYWLGTSNRFAYDDLGSTYDETDYECDDINPGDTLTCVLVFDVPTETNILGLDVEVKDHKRIPFTAPE